jgi:transcription elongation factor Elf1
MGEKEYKQVSNKDKKKKHKKYRDIKCQGDDCNTVIDIDLCISNEDIDYVDTTKSSIYVYCGSCGLQHEVKLK